MKRHTVGVLVQVFRSEEPASMYVVPDHTVFYTISSPAGKCKGRSRGYCINLSLATNDHTGFGRDLGFPVLGGSTRSSAFIGLLRQGEKAGQQRKLESSIGVGRVNGLG
jgi:hypothetical protein